MAQETFTRQEVIKIIDELLQRPDILIDAVENEMTDHDAESLLEFVEKLGV